jgi:ribonuclease H / adenosylcobalamin/alpha-ribazole phosphatase
VPEITTTILLIRHAHTPAVARYLAGRAPGVGLTARGLDQAAALVTRLEAQPLDAIYSSPLERARLTAAPLAEARGLEVRIGPDLDEVDFGVWTGLTFDALEARADWRRFNDARGSATVPGGEAPGATQARIAAALERMRRAHPGLVVAAFSHADVIRYAVLHVLGAPLDRVHRIVITPASVTTVRMAGGGPVLIGVNEGPRPG